MPPRATLADAGTTSGGVEAFSLRAGMLATIWRCSASRSATQAAMAAARVRPPAGTSARACASSSLSEGKPSARAKYGSSASTAARTVSRPSAVSERSVSGHASSSGSSRHCGGCGWMRLGKPQPGAGQAWPTTSMPPFGPIVWQSFMSKWWQRWKTPRIQRPPFPISTRLGDERVRLKDVKSPSFTPCPASSRSVARKKEAWP